MKLYWAPRTRSTRILWMLEETRIPYERVLVDIRSGAQRAPDYLAINPMGKVPALVDGAAVIHESGAICAYVADRYPAAGLAPAFDAPERGSYLRWLFFSGGCFEPALVQRFKGFEIDPGTAGWGDPDRVLDVLEQALAGGEWLLGEQFTAADVMIGSDLHFAIEGFKLIEPRPAFAAYLDRCKARPAFQRAQAIGAG
jgi:glutathione S-transferase